MSKRCTKRNLCPEGLALHGECEYARGGLEDACARGDAESIGAWSEKLSHAKKLAREHAAACHAHKKPPVVSWVYDETAASDSNPYGRAVPR